MKKSKSLNGFKGLVRTLSKVNLTGKEKPPTKKRVDKDDQSHASKRSRGSRASRVSKGKNIKKGIKKFLGSKKSDVLNHPPMQIKIRKSKNKFGSAPSLTNAALRNSLIDDLTPRSKKDSIKSRQKKRRGRDPESDSENSGSDSERSEKEMEMCQRNLSGLLLSRKSEFVKSKASDPPCEEPLEQTTNVFDDGSIMSGGDSSMDDSVPNPQQHERMIQQAAPMHPYQCESGRNDVHDLMTDSHSSMMSTTSRCDEPQEVPSKVSETTQNAANDDLAQMIAQLEAETNAMEKEITRRKSQSNLLAIQPQHQDEEPDEEQEYRHFRKPSAALKSDVPPEHALTPSNGRKLNRNWSKILDSADGDINVLMDELHDALDDMENSESYADSDSDSDSSSEGMQLTESLKDLQDAMACVGRKVKRDGGMVRGTEPPAMVSSTPLKDQASESYGDSDSLGSQSSSSDGMQLTDSLKDLQDAMACVLGKVGRGGAGAKPHAMVSSASLEDQASDSYEDSDSEDSSSSSDGMQLTESLKDLQDAMACVIRKSKRDGGMANSSSDGMHLAESLKDLQGAMACVVRKVERGGGMLNSSADGMQMKEALSDMQDEMAERIGDRDGGMVRGIEPPEIMSSASLEDQASESYEDSDSLDSESSRSDGIQLTDSVKDLEAEMAGIRGISNNVATQDVDRVRGTEPPEMISSSSLEDQASESYGDSGSLGSESSRSDGMQLTQDPEAEMACVMKNTTNVSSRHPSVARGADPRLPSDHPIIVPAKAATKPPENSAGDRDSYDKHASHSHSVMQEYTKSLGSSLHKTQEYTKPLGTTLRKRQEYSKPLGGGMRKTSSLRSLQGLEASDENQTSVEHIKPSEEKVVAPSKQPIALKKSSSRRSFQCLQQAANETGPTNGAKNHEWTNVAEAQSIIRSGQSVPLQQSKSLKKTSSLRSFQGLQEAPDEPKKSELDNGVQSHQHQPATRQHRHKQTVSNGPMHDMHGMISDCESDTNSDDDCEETFKDWIRNHSETSSVSDGSTYGAEEDNNAGADPLKYQEPIATGKDETTSSIADESEMDAGDWLLQQLHRHQDNRTEEAEPSERSHVRKDPSCGFLQRTSRQEIESAFADDASESTWTLYTVKTSRTTASNCTPINPSDFLPKWLPNGAPPSRRQEITSSSRQEMTSKATSSNKVSNHVQRSNPCIESTHTETGRVEQERSRQKERKYLIPTVHQQKIQNRNAVDPPETGRATSSANTKVSRESITPSIDITLQEEAPVTDDKKSREAADRLIISSKSPMQDSNVQKHTSSANQIVEAPVPEAKPSNKGSGNDRRGQPELSPSLEKEQKLLSSQGQPIYPSHFPDISSEYDVALRSVQSRRIENPRKEVFESNAIRPTKEDFSKIAALILDESMNSEAHDTFNHVVSKVISFNKLEIEGDEISEITRHEPARNYARKRLQHQVLPQIATEVEQERVPATTPNEVFQYYGDAISPRTAKLASKQVAMSVSPKQIMPDPASKADISRSPMATFFKESKTDLSKEASTEDSEPKKTKKKDKKQKKNREDKQKSKKKSKKKVDRDAEKVKKSKRKKSKERENLEEDLEKKEDAIRHALSDIKTKSKMQGEPEGVKEKDCIDEAWKSWSNARVKKSSDTDRLRKLSNKWGHKMSVDDEKQPSSKTKEKKKKRERSRRSKGTKSSSSDMETSSTESLLIQLESEKSRKKAKAKKIRERALEAAKKRAEKHSDIHTETTAESSFTTLSISPNSKPVATSKYFELSRKRDYSGLAHR